MQLDGSKIDVSRTYEVTSREVWAILICVSACLCLLLGIVVILAICGDRDDADFTAAGVVVDERLADSRRLRDNQPVGDRNVHERRRVLSAARQIWRDQDKGMKYAGSQKTRLQYRRGGVLRTRDNNEDWQCTIRVRNDPHRQHIQPERSNG